MSSSDQSHIIRCYENWTNLQKLELTQLLQALNQNPNPQTTELTQLINTTLTNFQSYIDDRRRLAESDATPYLAPTWCTSLENSALWIGGCRPSSFIRLIYALCGLEMESQLAEFLAGTGSFSSGSLGDLTAKQLPMINNLQMKIIREEELLSARLASLQEDLADQPISTVAAEKLGRDFGLSRDVDEAIEGNKRGLGILLGEADELRMSTLKELLSILTPIQGVRFLAASKKLRFCLQEWGKKKDEEHGRI